MRRGRVSSDKWIEIKHRVPSIHLPLSPSSSRTLKRSDFRASMGGFDSSDLTSQLPAHHEPPKSKNVKTKAMARSWKNNFILGPYSFTDKADLNMYSSVSFRVGL